MRYLCVMYGNADHPARDEVRPVDERCIVTHALQPIESAVTVRVRSGNVLVRDGVDRPTNDPLVGFSLIEARDLNDAIQVAARMPSARLGTIEVRPVRPIETEQRGETTMDDEAEIRAGAAAFAQALHDKDADGVLSHYAPHVRIFDLAPPLQYQGASSARRGTLTEWFATWDGPIVYEIRDLQIEIGGDLAIAHSLDHMSGTKTNGENPDLWLRTTVAYRRIDGQWRVTHVHESVPFDMTTFQALFDLRP